MSSGSPFIGDARDRAATFVARSHKTLPSLQVQTAPGDAFADVFRLIANASPAPNRNASRGSPLQADAGKEQEDAIPDAEKDSQAASGDPRRSRQQVEDLPQDASLVDGTLMAPAAEPIAAETEAATNPLTDEDDSKPQGGPLSEAEIAAARSPEDHPPTIETTSEAESVIVRGQAEGSATINENVAANPKIPTAGIPEASVPVPLGEDAPADAKLVLKPDGSNKPVADSSDDPALPKAASETLTTEPTQREKVSAEAVESEVTEQTGKPLFGGRDDERSDSRRRYERDPGRPSFPADTNRVATNPSSAETRGMQADILSIDAAADTTMADRAARGMSQAIETLQANAPSAPQPAVSAAAASASAASEAALPKASAKPTPQVGISSAPPGTAESAQQPAPKESKGAGVADRIRLVQRVANAFQRLGVDGGQVRIRLHPAELGGVRLDLQIQGKRLNARVTAETEAARGVLREHLPELRQRLVEQGMQIERIDVELETETQSHRDASHREASAGRFGQPQQRDQRAGSPLSERDQSGASIEAGPHRNPVERSVADAASRPGVDLVF